VKFSKNAFVWEKKMGYFDFKFCILTGKEKINEKTRKGEKKRKGMG